MATAIYLAHLNPLTNAHADIIKELEKKDEVVVMPVRFLVQEKEINSKSFPFSFEICISNCLSSFKKFRSISCT